MTDDNQPPQEQLLLGIFAGPQGMRIQSPMPPRELLLRQHDTGRVFSYEQCVKCTRWFPSEREQNAMAPAVCPYCDEARKAAAKASGQRLARLR